MIVNGTLNAIGTVGSQIVFAAAPPGSWAGLLFQNGSSGEIAYANITNANYAIRCIGALPSIHNNTISGNTVGLRLENIGGYSGLAISNSVIQSNAYYGV